MQAKSNCSAYPLQCIHHQIFCSAMCWNFSIELQDFHKRSFICGDCFSQCSPGAPGLQLGGGKGRSWSQFMSHFRVPTRMEVCMPITQHMGGWQWVLWYMMLVTKPKSNRVVAESLGAQNCSWVYNQNLVSGSVTWVWACLPKMTLFILDYILRFLQLLAWILQLLQKHFCPWIDTKLLLLKCNCD